MTPRIQRLLDDVLNKKQKEFRHEVDWKPLLQNFQECGTDASTRARLAFCELLAAEEPAFLPGETICFTRTVQNLPEIFSEEEMKALRKKAYYHEKGCVFNISPDYGSTIRDGLDNRREEILARLSLARELADGEGLVFLENALLSLDAVLNLVEKYRAAAEEKGLTTIAKTLGNVPHKGAKTFHEALQFLRILHYALWCEGEYHNGLGRIDQYLFPYLDADLKAGRLTEERALEELEEFFISCNKDSDLYIGVQQGDNGQSLMIGGVDREGKPAFNLLSRLCLKASRELRVIDPKINLRVDKNTPMEVFEEATELTRQGLGFPQYANDDVVIPGLVKLGYELEDARDYTVAACWEFIIPGCGMDIPNIGAVSFPAAVDTVLRRGDAPTFETFLEHFKEELFHRADELEKSLKVVEMLPGPFVSILCTGRIEAARDVSQGNKYNNFGIHGTGLSTAVDSLAAIRMAVYEKKLVTLKEMCDLVDTDFKDSPEILAAVRNSAPKMGNADPAADDLATTVLATFARTWEGRKNCRGGCFRAGTGSAMYYIWHANQLPASPDGRLTGEPFSANYSPALGVPVKGPISVIRSFTVPDLSKVINGGPLTLEIHDSAFREEDGVEKVAQLVKFFVDRGGHQLQINAVNRDSLIDAQKHPDKYRHLIVRVWGWSGYFVELDKPYQNQIIKRVELSV